MWCARASKPVPRPGARGPPSTPSARLRRRAARLDCGAARRRRRCGRRRRGHSVRSLRFLRTRSPPDAVNDAFIGAAARGASVVVMCPITTVKTRMEAPHAGARQYRSVGDALATIVRTQGAGALVRGLPPLLLTNVPFAAIHYASYRRLQALGRDYADGWTLNLVAGSLASTAATVATQPFGRRCARGPCWTCPCRGASRASLPGSSRAWPNDRSRRRSSGRSSRTSTSGPDTVPLMLTAAL